MAVKNLSELFEHEMKDIYYAEHRLVEALEQLASETKHREAKKAYTSHKRETQGQIKRLQKVFKLSGKVPEPERCPGIEGLLKEKQNFTKKEKPSQDMLDYFNLGAAAKAERYEISAYEGLIQIAQQLGMDQAVELLAQNLQEEHATLDKLHELSKAFDTTLLMPQQNDDQGAEADRSGIGKKVKAHAKAPAKPAKGAAASSPRATAGRAPAAVAGSTKGSTRRAAAGTGGALGRGRS